MPDTADFGFAQAGPMVLSANGCDTNSPRCFLAELAPYAPPVRSMSIDLSASMYEFSSEPVVYRLGDGRGVSPKDFSTSRSADL